MVNKTIISTIKTAQLFITEGKKCSPLHLRSPSRDPNGYGRRLLKSSQRVERFLKMLLTLKKLFSGRAFVVFRKILGKLVSFSIYSHKDSQAREALSFERYRTGSRMVDHTDF